MNATDLDSIGRENGVSSSVLAGIVAGGVVLVLAVVTTSVLIAALACHSRKMRQSQLHISYPMRPFTLEHNISSSSLTRVTDEQLLRELHSCLQDRSNKMGFKAKKTTESVKHTAHRAHHSAEERETAIDGNEVPAKSKIEIKIQQEPSQPRPITSPSPTHNTPKVFSFSMSKRPRLPTPNSLKGASSTGITSTSQTPVTHVRSSQWYDNIRMMLRPLANYRYSSRSLEEASGHYVNDGMGPPRTEDDGQRPPRVKATTNIAS